jgi:hypothetical protein
MIVPFQYLEIIEPFGYLEQILKPNATSVSPRFWKWLYRSNIINDKIYPCLEELILKKLEMKVPFQFATWT